MTSLQPAATAKRALRQAIRQRRAARSAAELAAAGSTLADVALALPELAAATIVAAYVGIGSEPPSLPLLERLAGAGVHVLLPVVVAGRTLDWAAFRGESSLAATGPVDLREPTGSRLGPAALRTAGLVLVPALAVDRRGIRLGAGGGYYDRALSAIAPGAATLAVVFADEVLDVLPAEPHDRPVTGALTPAGVVSFGTD